MKRLPLSRTLALLCLCYGCAAGPQTAMPGLSATMTAPAATATTRPVIPNPTSVPTMSVEAIRSLLPACPEMESLSEPVEFAWPNIELRLQELAYSQWGYFSCGQPQEEVSAYFKQTMRQPMYKMTETNWVKIEEGTLGVYFQSDTKLWVYLWVVPQPAEAQATYVVVAMADALAFEPEC